MSAVHDCSCPVTAAFIRPDSQSLGSVSSRKFVGALGHQVLYALPLLPT